MYFLFYPLNKILPKLALSLFVLVYTYGYIYKIDLGIARENRFINEDVLLSFSLIKSALIELSIFSFLFFLSWCFIIKLKNLL